MSGYVYFGFRPERMLSYRDGRKKKVVYRKKKDERSEIQIYTGNGSWEDVKGLWTDYFYHCGTGQELYDIDDEEAELIMENYDEDRKRRLTEEKER